jgi:uncharacterized damage-inducible protein DinB
MCPTTLAAAMDFARARLLGLLDAIEKSGADVVKVLAWRPGAGRAHIAWQAMHCAATHDKYFNAFILGRAATDEALVSAYGGGSTPVDANIPSLAVIRSALAGHFSPFRTHIVGASTEELNRVFKLPNGSERTVGDATMLLTWHEAHHQGQIHLTWNMFKAAHGL